MKKLIVLLLCTGSLMAQEVELKSADVHWTGYGAVGGYSLTGSLAVREAHFEQGESGRIAGGKVVFDMTSIRHDNKRLVRHLKSEDFFHVRKYTTASFTIGEVSETQLTGILDLRGVKKKIRVPYRFAKTDVNYKLSGRVEVDRTEFGVNYNSEKFFQNLGSNAIKDTFLLEFVLVLE